jgi:hypothetical protein
MDPVPEEVAGLAVDVAQYHASVGELRVPMPGERVAGLPVVVVGVEDDFLGRQLSPSSLAPCQSVPWSSSLPGVASVHSPSMKVVRPLTMIRS